MPCRLAYANYWIHQLAPANYTRPRSRSPPGPAYGPYVAPTAPGPRRGHMRSMYAVNAAHGPGKAPKTGDNRPGPD